ncbi:MAG: hypothetical protein ACRDQA_25535 [Nocardioidaceae bacterium]
MHYLLRGELSGCPVSVLGRALCFRGRGPGVGRRHLSWLGVVHALHTDSRDGDESRRSNPGGCDERTTTSPATPSKDRKSRRVCRGPRSVGEGT